MLSTACPRTPAWISPGRYLPVANRQPLDEVSVSSSAVGCVQPRHCPRGAVTLVGVGVGGRGVTAYARLRQLVSAVFSRHLRSIRRRSANCA